MTDTFQQQLITARRNQILDAAAIVFAERGFHPTTIRDVARQAGIADGTIYNYFDSKTALLLGIFERMKASILAGSAPLPENMDLRTFLQTFLTHPLNALQADNFALFRIIVSEMMVSQELRTLYLEQVLQPTTGLAEQVFRRFAAERGLTEEQASLTIRTVSSMILGLLLQRVMGDPVLEAHWEQLPDLIADLIVSGIGGISR
jgi:TetR/AcrR family fatty acid metabolism transcriptional regulator